MALSLFVLDGGGIVTGDAVELNVVGAGVTTIGGGVVAEVKGSPGLVETIGELTLAALSLVKEESTLSTELLRVNVPGGVGTVPASDIVGEVVRPKAPLSAVLTPLEVLIAGVTEDKALVDGDMSDGA